MRKSHKCAHKICAESNFHGAVPIFCYKLEDVANLGCTSFLTQIYIPELTFK